MYNHYLLAITANIDFDLLTAAYATRSKSRFHSFTISSTLQIVSLVHNDDDINNL